MLVFLEHKISKGKLLVHRYDTSAVRKLISKLAMFLSKYLLSWKKMSYQLGIFKKLYRFVIIT